MSLLKISMLSCCVSTHYYLEYLEFQQYFLWLSVFSSNVWWNAFDYADLNKWIRGKWRLIWQKL